MTAVHDASVASLLQQHTQPTMHQPPSPPTSSSGENYVCQWSGCSEVVPSAEILYDHVCERHVGRKSTNNLNLQCMWGTCRTTTVKRDHITSHIRVHVPLKPHKCDFCGKSFKRPQDLKKHVKTHAEDSMASRSPTSHHHHGYHSVPKSNGYYHDPTVPGYGYASNYGHAIPPAPHGYAGAGYGMAQASYGDPGLTESRKRGHDMLEHFFSDAKRRQIDAASYVDLGQRFGGLSGLQAGLGGNNYGYNMGYNQMESGYGAPMAAAQYSQMPQDMPMFSELKTKNDLLSIDHFLEQLQNTVYENPGRSPEVGSLPSTSNVPSLAPEDTPTPASSYSANSPASVHSTFNGRASNGGYPSLPSVSDLANMHSFGQPVSSLGDQYEAYNGSRRYSGGQLQRAVPATRENNSLPPMDDIKKESNTLPPIKIESASSSPSSSSSSPEEARNEAWVENMRVIEHLRHYIKERLEHNHFEESDGQTSAGNGERDGDRTPRAHRSPDKDVEMTDREKEVGSLYPVLRHVREGN